MKHKTIHEIAENVEKYCKVSRKNSGDLNVNTFTGVMEQFNQAKKYPTFVHYSSYSVNNPDSKFYNRTDDPLRKALVDETGKVIWEG